MLRVMCDGDRQPRDLGLAETAVTAERECTRRTVCQACWVATSVTNVLIDRRLNR